ncbi:unnamed protein product [Effrenium voratum]|uniref:C2 domain-containing protein n=1 Tax=Effrenium voratum TaxID=2562239 RepID=A0AA36JDG9_9DINO|nr:unnamed protein product [Effrenium voratum]
MLGVPTIHESPEESSTQSETSGWRRCFAGLLGCGCLGKLKVGKLHMQRKVSVLFQEEAKAARASLFAPKHEFINDLLEAQWPYISEWFNDIMRRSCEPALQALMPKGVSISFGEQCTLGTMPAVLQQIKASKFCEEESTTIRLDALLDYNGDCQVDVTCTVGSLVLTRLQLRGDIVIELAYLRKDPPWFSGVRIYFANRPKIDLEVQTALFGVEANFAFIKQKLVDALTSVISSQAVLPNRFCIAMGSSAMREVDLKTPTPQGVLRLEVLDAKDLPDPARSYWSNMVLRFGFSKETTEADPYVQATVGAQVEKTSVIAKSRAPKWSDCAFDFVVDDPVLQNLHLAVHDDDMGAWSWKQAEVLGAVEKKLSALLESQFFEAASDLPECWLNLHTGPGNLVPCGRLRVRAQWRPLSRGCRCEPESMQINVQPAAGLWSIGSKFRHEWLLVVDTLSASALPAHGSGLNHYVKISIQFDGTDVGPTYATGLSVGAGPIEHGQQMLTVGINPEIGKVLKEHPDKIYELWRARVKISEKAGDIERLRSGLGFSGPPLFVDAVWNHTSRILVDSLPSTSVKLTVLRLEKGQRRLEDGSVLGSASMSLPELQKRGGRFEDLLPLGDKDGLGAMSALQLRLRLHPLAAPPESGTSHAPQARLSRARTQWFAKSIAKVRALSFRAPSPDMPSTPTSPFLSGFATPEPRPEPSAASAAPAAPAAAPAVAPTAPTGEAPTGGAADFRQRKYFHASEEPSEPLEPEEQYEEDLHYLRCARRSALHRNCTKNMDDREDPAPVKAANASVQTELVEEPRVQVPDDSVLDDLQEEPKILEVMEVREALREVPEHEGKKLFLPRSSGHTRPSMSGE